MKKIILLLTLFLVTSFSSLEQSRLYCAGFKLGYCEGWKEVHGQFVVCPVAPVCPVPEINETEYKHGYNRGFILGYKHANNDNI